MLKGFKEFLARGNIVDLAVAVVIGTAFTALVTKFTDSIITPLINRIGVNAQSDVGILRIGIGGGQTIDLNVLLSAAINFFLIAFAVYFLVVLPYNTLRKKGRSSSRATPKSCCSPKSAICSRKRTGTRRRGTAAVGHHRQPTGLARAQNRNSPTLDPDSDLQARQLPDDLCR